MDSYPWRMYLLTAGLFAEILTMMCIHSLNDDCASSALDQVAAQPELSLLYRELLMSGDGCELYVRRARSYSKDLEQRFATFGDLEDTARRRGETMIG